MADIVDALSSAEETLNTLVTGIQNKHLDGLDGDLIVAIKVNEFKSFLTLIEDVSLVVGGAADRLRDDDDCLNLELEVGLARSYLKEVT